MNRGSFPAMIMFVLERISDMAAIIFGAAVTCYGIVFWLGQWISYRKGKLTCSYLGNVFATHRDRKYDYEITQLMAMFLIAIGLVLEGTALILR